MYRRALLGLISGIAIVSSANAADIYAPAAAGGYKDGPAPVYNWTGIYAGVQGGGMWGTQNLSAPGVHLGTNVDGGVAGGQLGAQFQFYNNLVLGVDFAGQGSFADGSAPCPNHSYSCDAKIRADIQIVGRAGYALGNFLPYFKGGYADTSMRSTATPLYAGFNESHDHSGWVIGGGLDYAVTPSIVLGVDYSHIEADSVTYSEGVAGAARNIDATLDTVTARLSYKFTPAAAPLK
ncbi:MAG: outer membrane protein [Rhodomicrobium sp.]